MNSNAEINWKDDRKTLSKRELKNKMKFENSSVGCLIKTAYKKEEVNYAASGPPLQHRLKQYLLISVTHFLFVVVVFQVCIQNRYKLNKKYRKWVSSLQGDGVETKAGSVLHQSRVSVLTFVSEIRQMQSVASSYWNLFFFSKFAFSRFRLLCVH